MSEYWNFDTTYGDHVGLEDETGVKLSGAEIDYAIKYVSRLGSVRLIDTFTSLKNTKSW